MGCPKLVILIWVDAYSDLCAHHGTGDEMTRVIWQMIKDKVSVSLPNFYIRLLVRNMHSCELAMTNIDQDFQSVTCNNGTSFLKVVVTLILSFSFVDY